jgi:exodeoxyribonuclease-3
MQIATWNVNSIRTRLEHLLTWLESDIGSQVDVVCLQETKVKDEDFPHAPFAERGLHTYIYGQKAYNGVALIARQPLEEVTCGFTPVVGDRAGDADEQKRVISALFRGVRIVNLYVPNGSEVESDKYRYKLNWLQLLEHYLKAYLPSNSTTAGIVMCGDFNIALEDRDIYNPEGKATHIMASPQERQALESVLKLGFRDAFRKFIQEGGQFSWWDYRAGGFARNRGWRIDHHYLTPQLYEQAIACTIDREPRSWEKPSDHTPVIVTLADG